MFARGFGPDLRLLVRRSGRLLRRPGWFVRRYWPALLVLLTGASLDAMTTIPNVRQFGPLVEANPVHRLVMAALGATVGTIIGKIVQVAFVVLVAGVWPPWCPWVMVVCGLLYTAAAVSNHLHLL